MAQRSQDPFTAMFVLTRNVSYHTREMIHWILALFLTWNAAHAAGKGVVMVSPGSIGVRTGPGDGYLQSFFLVKGERVGVVGEEGDYSKIRVRRNGKVVGGYVLTAELTAKVAVPELPEDGWALGFGPLISSLSQKGKSFQTEDQVTYNTATYTSVMPSTYFWLQVYRRDFWRIFAGFRLTNYKSSATTDIPGTTANKIEVRHKMFSFGVQRAWTPLKKFQPFYIGIGGEAARTLSINIKVDGAELPTSSEDLPLYIGAHGFAGLQFMFGRSWSLSGELRAGKFFNQNVTAIETGATAYYWF